MTAETFLMIIIYYLEDMTCSVEAQINLSVEEAITFYRLRV